jgi:hypothetical protein
MRPPGYVLRLLAVALLTGPVSATATTILFDTGTPTYNAGGMWGSRYIVAGQFTVGQASTITGAGIYVFSTEPALPHLTGWDGMLSGLRV